MWKQALKNCWGFSKEYMYTRIPVYQDDNDNIIGLVNIKDFILVEDRENFRKSRDILRMLLLHTANLKRLPIL